MKWQGMRSRLEGGWGRNCGSCSLAHSEAGLTDLSPPPTLSKITALCGSGGGGGDGGGGRGVVGGGGC